MLYKYDNIFNFSYAISTTFDLVSLIHICHKLVNICIHYLCRCTSKAKEHPKNQNQCSIFNQFPANFPRPDAPDEETISKQINPISCEWFGRPKVAMSKFADTITQNMELLKGEDMKHELIDPETFSGISEEIQPFLDALGRLNTKKNPKDKKDEEPLIKDDIKQVMSFLYNPSQPLDRAVEEMFLVGAAMFTTATQYIVARSLVRDHEKFAEKLILQNKESKKFKKCRDVRALRWFLEAECLGATSSSSMSSTTTSKVRRALMSQLEDSQSEDDEDEHTTSHGHRNTRPRMEEVESDDDVVEQPPQKKKKKSKKAKKGKQ